MGGVDRTEGAVKEEEGCGKQVEVEEAEEVEKETDEAEEGGGRYRCDRRRRR